MTIRNCLYWALIPALLSVAGCKEGPPKDHTNSANPSQATGVSTVGDRLAQVRSEIVARNFGRAAELGREAVNSFPNDPEASFELARAEALAGNQGYALDALEQAVTKGLANANLALKDEAFAALRTNSRFKELLRTANPSSRSATPAQHRPAPEPSSISAGGHHGVEIQESGGSTTIRAGDVTLHTDF